MFEIRSNNSSIILWDTINPVCPTSDGNEDAEKFCCSALHLMFNDKIFSQELLNYYDHLYNSPIFQKML